MKYTPYRRALAWIGFIAAYILLPILLALTIYRLTATNAAPSCPTPTDRTEFFYQQTAPTL